MQSKKIAVTGMACRFPLAKNYEQFWENLKNGRDAIDIIPSSRWDTQKHYSPDPNEPNKSISKWCGIIDEIENFDHRFFKIPKSEAVHMDPQQRILLEETWKCIEDACIPLNKLQQKRTSVFIGVMSTDFQQKIVESKTEIGGATCLGNYDCILANRISHFFKFSGKSISIAAACASSLYAVHEAKKALLDDECDYAIVGGVSLNLHPMKYISFSKKKMLSPDGRCKTFDVKANGYVPGDGVGVLLLQRFNEAQRQKNIIHGIILGSAVNHCGGARTITAPKMSAQKSVIISAYKNAGISPETVNYIETHGTGTSLGDPIEVAALIESFRTYTESIAYCTLGSVKTNIGHLEAAAGIAGLIKVLLMMKYRQIPANLNFDVLNPLIDLTTSPFKISHELSPWVTTKGRSRLRAGVSAFGFGGQNSHVLLENYNPGFDRKPGNERNNDPEALFVLSADTPQSLQKLLRRWKEFVKKPDFGNCSINDICGSLAIGRKQFSNRIGLYIKSKKQLMECIKEDRFEIGSCLKNNSIGLKINGCAYKGLKIDDAIAFSRIFTRKVHEFKRILYDVTGTKDIADAFVYEKWPENLTGLFQFGVNYCALETMKKLGLCPDFVVCEREGVWVGLVFCEMIRVDTVVTIFFEKRIPENPKIHHSTINFFDQTHGCKISTIGTFDTAIFKRLKDTFVISDVKIPAIIHKFRLLRRHQFSFSKLVAHWEELLQPYRTDFELIMEEIKSDTENARRKNYILVFMITYLSSYKEIMNIWDLKDGNQNVNQDLNRIVDLVSQGELKKSDLLSMIFNDIESGETGKEPREPGEGKTNDHHKTTIKNDDLKQWLPYLLGDTPRTKNKYAEECKKLQNIVRVAGAPHRIVSITLANNIDADLKDCMLKLWLNGVSIKFNKIFYESNYNKLQLPNYEFDSEIISTATRLNRTNSSNEKLLYCMEKWRKSSLQLDTQTGGPPGLTGAIPNIFIFEGTGERFGIVLKKELRKFGYEKSQISIIRSGSNYTASEESLYEINANRLGDYKKIFENIPKTPVSPNIIIHLQAFGSDAEIVKNDGSHCSASMEPTEYQEKKIHSQNILSLYYLINAVSALNIRGVIRLFNVYQLNNDLSDIYSRSLTGYASSIKNVLPGMKICSMEIADCNQSFEELVKAIIFELNADEKNHARTVLYRQNKRYIKKIEEIQSGGIDETTSFLKQNGVYLICGGAGGLGYQFSQYLTETYHAKLVWTGRSETNEAINGKIGAIEKTGGRVIYITADVGKPSEMEKCIKTIKDRFGRLDGVFHAAGAMSDSSILQQSPEQFTGSLLSKIHGTIILDEVTKHEQIDCFILFSSISSIIGDFGQCNYAIGNAFLNAFASYREKLRIAGKRSGKTISMSWPLWREGGIHLSPETEQFYLKTSKLKPLDVQNGFDSFEKMLAVGHENVALFYGDKSAIMRMLYMNTSQQPQDRSPIAPFSYKEKQHDTSCHDERTIGIKEKNVCLKLRKIIAQIVSMEPTGLDMDENLFDLGLDSVHLTDFSNKINATFELDITPVTFFTRNTISSLATYIIEVFCEKNEIASKMGQEKNQGQKGGNCARSSNIEIEKMNENEAVPEFKNSCNHSPEDRHVAIIGISAKLPGADNLSLFWENMINGRSMADRFPDHRFSYQENKETSECRDNKNDFRYGCFLRDIDKFDSEFFNISPREAEMMDPQLRLLIETVWKTIEDSGYDIQQFEKRPVGVFVGSQFDDYRQLLIQEKYFNAQAFTGNSKCMLANRMSFLYDFRGPSETIDTACSSSLTAVHRAVRSVQCGESELAIAAGVSLISSFDTHQYIGTLGILSADGLCRTFDDNANGYVRGEGVGAVLLKPLSKAIEDNDNVYAAIIGSAVNHGGRSASLTAPNSEAQADLIISAFEDANVAPDTITYIETHGTGTKIGDPIEYEGLKAVFNRNDGGSNKTEKSNYCGLGAIKTHIGHLEPASGIAGLLKAVLSMQHKLLPGNRNFSELNSYINLEKMPFYLIDKTKKWDNIVDKEGNIVPLRAGISSFGSGGSNAHIVLEAVEAPNRLKNVYCPQHQIFVLSANSKEQLYEYAKLLLKHILKIEEKLQQQISDGGKEKRFERTDIYETDYFNHMAYTLQVGRRPMPFRLAMVVSNMHEILQKLREFCAGAANIPDLRFGKNNRDLQSSRSEKFALGADSEVISASRSALKEIAFKWVDGVDIDWRFLYPGKKPKRISLPTYPFKKTTCWFDASKKHTRIDSIGKEKECGARKTREYNRIATNCAQTDYKTDNLLDFYFVLEKIDQLSRILVLKSFHENRILEISSIKSAKNRHARMLRQDLRHQKLLDATIGSLSEFGALEVTDPENIELTDLGVKQLQQCNLLTEKITCECLEKFSTAGPYITLIKRCAKHYFDVINGKMLYSEVLFPKGQFSLLENIYAGNPASDVFNAYVSEKTLKEIKRCHELYPRNAVQILEIGAGTGATTEHILKAVCSDPSMIEYVYTDISKGFLDYGRNKFRERYPFVRFGMLDIEKKPERQDYDINCFDIVLATNVLHATKDITMTLKNLRKLIKPGGIAIINEITQNTDFYTLTFGLTNGWWRFQDPHLRLKNSPLLSASTWVEILEENGFKILELMGEPGSNPEKYRQSLLVAKKDLISVRLQDLSTEKAAGLQVISNGGVPKDTIKSSLEEQIIDCIGGYLKISIEKIALSTPFSKIGIDSIMALSLVESLNRHLDVQLRPTILLDCNNVEALAKHIQKNCEMPERKLQCADALDGANETGSAKKEKQVGKMNDMDRNQRLKDNLMGFHGPCNATVDETVCPGAGTAIVGMSCRFPGAENAEAFWDNLKNKKTAITEIPKDRWDLDAVYSADSESANKSDCRWGAFLSDVDMFDASFFEISPLEAEKMDPQQRIFLETVWHAIENAGYNAADLSGMKVGVFIGVSNTDYKQMLRRNNCDADHMTLTGLVNAVIANRVSYFFNFKGPSEVIDTTCSSSVSAINRAVRALETGECEIAIAGGINIIIDPYLHIELSKADMLSSKWPVKVFENDGSGFVRCEGSGAVILKPLAKAERARDHIYGVIKGVTVNHCGRSRSLISPKPASIAETFKEACTIAKIDPEAIQYIEMQGAGKKIGDQVEFDALTMVFPRDATSKTCGIGCLKPNIGHSESVSGIAALCKILLSIQNNLIPPTIQYGAETSLMEKDRSPLFVVKNAFDWAPVPDDNGKPTPRCAGISSYGLAGSIGFLIVAAYNRQAGGNRNDQRMALASDTKDLFVFSHKNRGLLKSYLNVFKRYLMRDITESLSDIAFTLRAGRSPFDHRVAIIAHDKQELLEKIEAVLTENHMNADIYITPVDDDKTFLRKLYADVDSQELLEKWLVKGELEKLAELWACGVQIAWEKLRQPNCLRVPLPGYLFDHKPYWAISKKGTIPTAEAEPVNNREGAFEPVQRIESEEAIRDLLVDLLASRFKIPKDEIRIDKNVRKYGLDSFSGMMILNRLKRIFGFDVSIEKFFRLNTVKDMAEFLWNEAGSDRKRIEYSKIGDSDSTMATDRDSGQSVETQTSDSMEAFPLSEGQAAIYSAYLYDPENAAYNTPVAFKLSRDIDIQALRAALQILYRRHGGLRTVVVDDREGRLIQKQSGPSELSLEIVTVNEKLNKRRIERIKKDAKTPFNIEKAPYIRATLYRCLDEDAVLLLNFHHLIIDGISFQIFLDELKLIYYALLSNIALNLPPSANNYSDYIDWQNAYLKSDKGERDRQYWMRELHGIPSDVSIVPSKEKKAIRTFKGDTYIAEMDELLSTKVEEIAVEYYITPFSVTLAAFILLLHSHENAKEIFVNTPTSGRPEEKFEKTIGYFLNVLMIRVKLDGSLTIRELLSHVHQKTLKALEHGFYPLQKIINEIKKTDKGKRTDFHQVAFYFQNWMLRDFGRSDSFLKEYIDEIHQEGEFDFVLEITKFNNKYNLYFKYHPDLFSEKDVTVLCDRYCQILRDITASPQARIAELQATDRKRIPSVCKKKFINKRAYPKNKKYFDFFSESALRHPDKDAVFCRDSKLSYGELHSRVSQLANYLTYRKIEKGQFVGIFLERSIEMLVAIIAVSRAGCVFVPMDPDWPRERLAYMAMDAGVGLLITQHRLVDKIPVTVSDKILIDRQWNEIEEINASTEMDTAPGVNSEIAYIMYTSGSTGKPKGVQILHKSLTNFLMSMSEKPGFQSDDHMVAITTISFDIALLELFLPLVNGGSIEILPNEVINDGLKLKRRIEKSDITVLQGTPSTFRFLLAAGWRSNHNLKILCGGEPLPPELAETLMEGSGEVWNMYGPTETTIWSSVHQLEKGGGIGIGLPIWNTEFYVLDGHMEYVAPNRKGELYIGGDGLSIGYFNKPDLTRTRFVPNPFSIQDSAVIYRTGDVVRYSDNGAIEFVGRADNQIKLRGHRIELGEIESRLKKIETIDQAVVVIREDLPSLKQIVAFCTLRPDRSATHENSLKHELENWLPNYMIPDRIKFCRSFPLTNNRKIDRKCLSDEDIEIIHSHHGLDNPDPNIAAADCRIKQDSEDVKKTIKNDLVDIFSKLLKKGKEEIAPECLIAELGLDSIIMTQLRYEIETKLKVGVSVSKLSEIQNIEELTDYIALEKKKIASTEEAERNALENNALLQDVLNGIQNLEHYSEEELDNIFMMLNN